MDDDDALTVGRFAKLAGLTVHTLRHYDAVGLLKPDEVDPDTAYRRYRRGQLPAARLIKDLRWLDLPIDQVRIVLADPRSDAARTALQAHAARLGRLRRHVSEQLQHCTHHTDQGVDMPTTTTDTAPVQIKLGVADLARAREFYAAAFGMGEGVIRHTEDEDFPGYRFGVYGQPGFFLVVLVGQDAFDCPGRSTVGFTVPDLDAAHRSALAAGATEVVAVNDPEGMPRNSAVTDPDGNWIWLYQG